MKPTTRIAACIATSSTPKERPITVINQAKSTKSGSIIKLVHSCRNNNTEVKKMETAGTNE